jgi:FMN-dependent NADH-azoreductase
VYVALARGGLYRDTPNDSQVPYLKSVLGFLGLTDVRFIYAEGLAMGPEAAAKGFAQATADLDAALA